VRDVEQQMLVDFFRIVSDDERLRIIGFLANHDRSADELASLLRIKPSAVVHHLAKLEGIGIVRAVTSGTSLRYALDIEALRHMRQEALSRRDTGDASAPTEGDDFTRRALRNNVKGERLLRIPANRRTRDVILDWLAGKFDPEATYTEKEVNEIIKERHPDAAALRRELVDGKWLQRTRDGSRYWCTPGGAVSLGCPAGGTSDSQDEMPPNA